MVVMGHVDGKIPEEAVIRPLQDAADDLRTLRRVFFHLVVFLRRVTARLPQDLIIHGDFPQIMHRRRLDQSGAEGVRELELGVLFDFLHQDLHHIAGPPDMSAGGIVPAFHHDGHSHDQAVMHFDEMAGLFRDLFLKLCVVAFQQRKILLVFGVVGDEKLIADPALSHIEISQSDLIGPVLLVIQHLMVFLILPEGLDPGEHILGDQMVPVGGAVDLQLLERRKDQLCRFVAAQVVTAEIKVHEACFALLDQGIDRRVCHIVIAYSVDDEQIEDARDGVGGRHQINASLVDLLQKIDADGDHLRQEEQQQDPIGRLLLPKIAVNDGGKADHGIQDHQDVEIQMERAVDLFRNQRNAVHLNEGGGTVEPGKVSDRQNAEVQSGGEADHQQPELAVDRDAAQPENGKRDEQREITSPQIDDL